MQAYFYQDLNQLINKLMKYLLSNLIVYLIGYTIKSDNPIEVYMEG